MGHPVDLAAKIGFDGNNESIVSHCDDLVLDRVAGGSHGRFERFGETAPLDVDLVPNPGKFG